MGSLVLVPAWSGLTDHFRTAEVAQFVGAFLGPGRQLELSSYPADPPPVFNPSRPEATIRLRPNWDGGGC